MRNFQLLQQRVDVIPLLNAVMRQPELWNQNNLRTTHPASPHTRVDDIWLRFNRMPEPGQEAKVIDEHESVNYPALFMLPQARELMFGLMALVQGERLGRALITRLAPGQCIDPHVDGGAHAEYYDRFHIVLQGLPGSLFRCGDETVSMHTGECWWFQNGIEHEVINNSADDRIHLVVDIRTSR